MSSWKVFAFNKTDEREDRRDGLPVWRLPEAVEWATARYDTVLIEHSDRDPLVRSPLSVHHVCSDSRCPGGCE